MRNLTRAQRKKAMRQFKVGDVVTFGRGTYAYRVVEVSREGVVIDVTACKDVMKHIDIWARPQPDGKYFMTVLFDHNVQGSGPRCIYGRHGVTSGPPVHTDMEPDKC